MVKAFVIIRYLALVTTACFCMASTVDKSRNGRQVQNEEKLHGHLIEKLVNKADSFVASSQKDSAMMYYAQAYGLYHEGLSEDERHWCAVSALRLADIYYYSSNCSMGLELYIKGLRIMENCTNRNEIAQFYIGLGNVYWLFEDLENAGFYYEKGYKESILHKDTVSQIRIANHLTGIYCYTKDDSKAEYYMNEANRLNPDTVTQKYMNMLHKGLICLIRKEPSQAAKLFVESGNYAAAHAMHPKYECSSYEELYKLYKSQGNTDSMKLYLNKCYDILSEYPMINMLPNCLKNMAMVYQKEGNIKMANSFQERYIRLTDSVFQVREVNKLRTMQILYGAEKLNNNIDTLMFRQKEYVMTIEKQRFTIIAIAVGLVFVLLISLFVYNQRCKFLFLYKKLFLLNNELTDALNKSREMYNKYKEESSEYKKIIDEQKARLDEMEDDDARPRAVEEKYKISGLKENQKEKLLADISEVMENSLEYCSCDFSLNRLSALVNSNSRYVSQVINEQYHKNFNNFCNSYRIREACRRFNDKENFGFYTIKAISESVGYKSQTTFIKAFKDETGMSPSVYQKIARSNN